MEVVKVVQHLTRPSFVGLSDTLNYHIIYQGSRDVDVRVVFMC